MLDGDDGMTLTFHADQFQKIAKIIRAHTTRTLSEARRAALIAAGSAHRFGKQATDTNGSIPTNDQ